MWCKWNWALKTKIVLLYIFKSSNFRYIWNSFWMNLNDAHRVKTAQTVINQHITHYYYRIYYAIMIDMIKCLFKKCIHKIDSCFQKKCIKFSFFGNQSIRSYKENTQNAFSLKNVHFFRHNRSIHKTFQYITNTSYQIPNTILIRVKKKALNWGIFENWII